MNGVDEAGVNGVGLRFRRGGSAAHGCSSRSGPNAALVAVLWGCASISWLLWAVDLCVQVFRGWVSAGLVGVGVFKRFNR